MKRTRIIIASVLAIAVLASAVLVFFKKSPEPQGPEQPVKGPAILSYSVAATYPHDTASYTEGLQIFKDALYESTGNYGFSKLRKLDLKTGKVEKEISLDKQYFGEGLTILHDTAYQLTYKENKVFVYTVPDLKKVKEFDISISEGWGMTNDGKNLIVNTGGSDLLYFDPATFKLLKTQTVLEGGVPSHDVNEMEYIDGFIYANQYQLPYILKIDPATGEVVAKADITRLWDQNRNLNPKADVPNGIAYDSTSKKMYITGKWWPELYEIQFSK